MSFTVWVGYLFLMILRVSAIFTVSPVFGRRNVPPAVKIGLSVLIAYISINVYPPSDNTGYENLISYTSVCVKEILVGLILGIVTNMFFATVHTAGQLIDMQIGFGFAGIFDPTGESHIPIVGGMLQIILLICFFAADGHHLLIMLISDTFRIIPVGTAAFRPEIAMNIAEIFVTAFVISIKIAMPVLAASLMMEAMLGILMRAVPQMNFFVVGFPIKILAGLLMILMLIPVFTHATESIFNNMMDAINKTFEGLIA